MPLFRWWAYQSSDEYQRRREEADRELLSPLPPPRRPLISPPAPRATATAQIGRAPRGGLGDMLSGIGDTVRGWGEDLFPRQPTVPPPGPRPFAEPLAPQDPGSYRRPNLFESRGMTPSPTPSPLAQPSPMGGMGPNPMAPRPTANMYPSAPSPAGDEFYRRREMVRGEKYPTQIGGMLGGQRGMEQGRAISEGLRRIGDFTREEFTVPMLGSLMEQSPVYRGLQTLMPNTLPAPQGPMAPIQNPLMAPLRVGVQNIGRAFRRATGDQEAQAEHERISAFEEKLPPWIRIPGEMIMDPFGMPANMVITALAPHVGLPKMALQAYRLADGIDFLAYMASSTPEELKTKLVTMAAFKGGATVARYAPKVLQDMRRFSEYAKHPPSDDELARLVGRRLAREDLTEARRTGQNVPERIPIYDMNTKTWTDVGREDYFQEMALNAMKQVGEGGPEQSVGSSIRRWLGATAQKGIQKGVDIEAGLGRRQDEFGDWLQHAAEAPRERFGELVVQEAGELDMFARRRQAERPIGKSEAELLSGVEEGRSYLSEARTSGNAPEAEAIEGYLRETEAFLNSSEVINTALWDRRNILPEDATKQDWSDLADELQTEARRLSKVQDKDYLQHTVRQQRRAVTTTEMAFGQETAVSRGAFSRREAARRVSEEWAGGREGLREELGTFLEEAGFKPEDIAKTNLQQRQRLLEELGEGEISRTKRGPPRKIDEVDVEAREAAIARTDPETAALAKGIAETPTIHPDLDPQRRFAVAARIRNLIFGDEEAFSGELEPLPPPKPLDAQESGLEVPGFDEPERLRPGDVIGRRRQQESMFQKGEDLPIFSGTAQRAETETYRPEVATRQTRLEGLPQKVESRLEFENVESDVAKPGGELQRAPQEAGAPSEKARALLRQIVEEKGLKAATVAEAIREYPPLGEQLQATRGQAGVRIARLAAANQLLEMPGTPPRVVPVPAEPPPPERTEIPSVPETPEIVTPPPEPAPREIAQQRTAEETTQRKEGTPLTFDDMARGHLDEIMEARSLPFEQRMWAHGQSRQELAGSIAQRYTDGTEEETTAIIDQLYRDAAQELGPDVKVEEIEEAAPTLDTQRQEAETSADTFIQQVEAAEGVTGVPEEYAPPRATVAESTEAQEGPTPELPAVETHNSAANVHGRTEGEALIAGRQVRRNGERVTREDVRVLRDEWLDIGSNKDKLALLRDQLPKTMLGKIDAYRKSLDTLARKLDAAMGTRRAEGAKAREEVELAYSTGTEEQAELPGIKIMVTNADKVELRSLGYEDADIRGMKPEEAQRIIDAQEETGSTTATVQTALVPTTGSPGGLTQPPSSTTGAPLTSPAAPSGPGTGGGGAGAPPPGGTTPVPTPADPAEELRRLQQARQQPEVAFRDRLNDAVDRFMIQWVDRLHPFRGLTSKAQSNLYALARKVPGSSVAGKAILERHVYPVLNEVKDDIDNLTDYMDAMRMQDLRKLQADAKLPGRVEDPTAALQGLKATMSEERFRAIEEAAQKIWDLNDEFIVSRELAEGILSPEAYEAIREKWPHYINWNRQDMSDTGAFANISSREPANLSRKFSEALKQEGSYRNLDSPLERFLAQFVSTQQRIARNQAGRSLVDTLKEIGAQSGETLVRRRTKGMKPSRSEDVVSYWEKGYKTDWFVPKELAAVARSMDAEPTNALVSILRAAAQPLRVGATAANPAFLVVNPIRDAATAWMQIGLKPFGKDWIEGWAAALTHNETWEEAAEAGIFVSGLSATARSQKGSLEAHIRGRGQPLGIPLKSAKDAMLWLPRLLMEWNERTEQGTRVAAWLHLRDLPEAQRVLAARDATVDFNSAGNAMAVINQVRPFTNIGVQAGANTIRLIRNTPRKAFLRALPFVGVGIFLHAWNSQFDTEELIPDYEYANNYIVQIGEGREEPDPRFPERPPRAFPIYLKIPKGDTIKAITAVPEAIMMIARSRGDKKWLEHFLDAGKTIARSLSPVEGSASELLLPGSGTLVELAMNRDVFRDQDIVPQYEMARPPEAQYDAKVPAVAVALGQTFRVSPRKIDHAIRGIGGGGGRFWLETLPGVALRGLGYDPAVPGNVGRRQLSEIERVAELPVVNRFIGTRRTEQVRTSYRKMDRQIAKTRRVLYKNEEFKRFGLGIMPPSATYQKDGVQHEIPAEQRLEILQKATPRAKLGLDILITQEFYQMAPDADKRRMLVSLRGKIQTNVRDNVLHGAPLWSEEHMPELVDAMQQYQEYTEIPTYVGLSAEQIALVRMANARVTAIRKANPNIQIEGARRIAATENPQGVRLAMIATKMRNPARKTYWAGHPLLNLYYGSLTRADLQKLGLLDEAA